MNPLVVTKSVEKKLYKYCITQAKKELENSALVNVQTKALQEPSGCSPRHYSPHLNNILFTCFVKIDNHPTHSTFNLTVKRIVLVVTSSFLTGKTTIIVTKY